MSQRDPATAIPLPREGWRFAETERTRLTQRLSRFGAPFRRLKTIKTEIGRRDYQAIGFRSLKKPPVGLLVPASPARRSYRRPPRPSAAPPSPPYRSAPNLARRS